MLKTIKLLVAVCLLGVLAMGSAGSYAYTASCPSDNYPLNNCSLEGVTPGSFPYFDNTVNVTYKGKKSGVFNVTAKAVKNSPATLVVDPETEYSIDKMKYSLKAKVDDAGPYGSLKVKGRLDDGTKFKVTANLGTKDSRGALSTSADNTLWGFNTYDIVCKGLEGIVNCTQSEVVFLNMLSPIVPFASGKVSAAGIAVTSVPLPAAAWLFGSGLMGLIAVSRRRSSRAV